MYYFITALAIFAFIGLFYRIIFPANEPNFELMGIQSDESLRLSIMDIAEQSKVYKDGGKGLSVRIISSKVKKAYKIIKAKIENNESCYDFEHWIYDNYYKLNESIQKQKKQLLGYTKLPHVRDLPRIYNFLQCVVKASGGAHSKEQLAELTTTYCGITPLAFCEINTLKGMLEFCLLEYIAIFCAKAVVISNKINRAKGDAAKGRINLAEINFNSYVFGMEKYASQNLMRAFDTICLSNGLDMRQRIDNFFRRVSIYSGSIQAAITNLHQLVSLDDEYIIKLSPLDKLLSGEPRLNYNNCTLATRYVYLYNLDRIARRKKINELYLTREIIDKAENNNIDIAEYILSKKRSKSHMRVYISSILLTNILLGALAAVFIFNKTWWITLVIFPIIFGVSLMFTHEFLGIVVKRRYLPRKKIEEKDFARCKTMILFSRLIADISEVDDTFMHLETIRYANGEQLFSYGVVIDFLTSQTAELGNNENEIILRCKEHYQKLKNKERYNIFIRKRTQISGDNKFQGWEKKRGALLDVNNLILNNGTEKFELILGNSYEVEYIIALDSDTLLNCGKELVEIMEHPYNKEKNIVSLSMGTNPLSANKTAFSRLMSGGVGLGNYSEVSNDINFDVYGHGNYTGKGIYRVDGFHSRVSDKFMDNRILSHDFIEGAMAGCANTSEKALDSFPSNFSSFLTRQQRWLRGDWQLLPYLFGKIRNKEGRRIKNSLSPIDKWHIFCNLISSLIPIASLISLMLSLFFAPWQGILLCAFILNVFSLLNTVRISTLKNPKSAALELLRQLYNISCLPIIAVYSFYSIVITLSRLLRKKKLLEWKAFAHSKGKSSSLPNLIAGAFIVTFAIILRLNIIYYILAFVFLAAPLVNHLISIQKINRNSKIAVGNKDRLTAIARRTWRFFEKQFESGLSLPVDNFQEYLEIGYAMRTSPTNIGMALTSVCSALELGFIDNDKANKYIEKIITSIEEQEKWHGNLYNWIDISTLTPLIPKYVSVVDSGNLLVGLLVSSCYVTHNILNERIYKLIENTEIEKLYDEQRGLFYIGYNDTEKAFDKNHYDLLASESILTYLVSIGLGKINKSAWNNLSRQQVRYYRKLLYSWTGGMFEYLMPSIFFEYPRHGMLDVSARNAVFANIRYAKTKKHRFWGISESQHNKVDNNGNYQYKAFGVPNISLSNSPDSNVFAPYASCLALLFNSKAASQNINKMSDFGMLDEFGFFESCDNGEIIKTYMSHHQGMILSSITNFLTDNAIHKKMKENACVRAAELLLTIPQNFGYAKKKIRSKSTYQKSISRDLFVHKHYVLPKLNLLSGGKYNLSIDEFGKGHTLYENIYLSRCDRGQGMEVWVTIDGADSATPNKKISLIDNLCVTHSFCGTRFQKTDKQISTVMNVFVLPNISGEIRDISIKNTTEQNLEITLYSMLEIALATKDDYIAHRAYSNMFIHSEYDADGDFILITRRNKNYPYFAHYFTLEGAEYSANRQDSFDRYKGKNNFGNLLDTAVCGKLKITLAPFEDFGVQIINLVSYDLEYLKRQVKMTRSRGYLKRISAECFSISKQLNPNQKMKNVASKLLYAPKNIKPSLLELGFNVDIPLVLLELTDINSLQRLKNQLNSFKKLYKFDINFNIAILYNEKSGYFAKIKDALYQLLEDISINSYKTQKSTVILLNRTTISKSHLSDLENSATNIFDIEDEVLDYTFFADSPKYKNAALPPVAVDLPMGIGGFLTDGSYFMDLTNVDTPAPWSNIIANESFGTLITESGGGYTYFKNARENKLTSWGNDCFEDYPSESIILQEDNVVWSITKKPIKTDSNYRAIHSFGYSEFINNYNGCIACEKQYIYDDTKFFDISIENCSQDDRTISIAAIFEAVLGTSLAVTSLQLDFSREENTLIATNLLSGSRFFVQSNYKLTEFALFRECFSDANGNINRAKGFGNKGHKKCIAYSVTANLKAKAKIRVIFSLGIEKTVDFSKCDSYFNYSKRYYSDLSVLNIKTGSAELDYLIKWLPYQTLTSRFFARTGFYQAGGAKGFRDQLQDCLAVLYINPQLVHDHILCAASHQFEDGDVQHWWHEPNIGVRTKISDDKLFLPLITAEYIKFTGDDGILSKRVPYLKNISIPKGEAGVYSAAEPTEYSGSILEHCIAAIKSAQKLGDNGLVLMGGGDWNDAMDLIGINGKGTSVWCSMFLYYVLGKFLPFVSDFDLKQEFVATRKTLADAVNLAWDGEWYLRAFTDDGREVGGKNSNECKIDLITQSFAKISEIAPPEKTELALYSAANKLIDTKNGLIKLLTPPFEKTKGIGYISHYPAGVRENGGQYTHGAVWFIISQFQSGKIQLAYDLLEMLNPINKGKTYDDITKYAVEPYVLAADVYSGEHEGRGGWTWYTGAAAWYYKCVVENLLGIKIEKNLVVIEPNLPVELKNVKIEYKTSLGKINIEIENTDSEGDWHVQIGNIKYNTASFVVCESIIGKTVKITKSKK